MTGCLNGGSCFPDEGKQNFSCSCQKPWTGETCELIGNALIYTELLLRVSYIIYSFTQDHHRRSQIIFSST